MKKMAVDKVITNVLIMYLIIQPIFDLKIFYNSYSTLIRIISIGIIFIYYFLKEKTKNKIYMLAYTSLIFIYFLLHNINAHQFTSLVPGNFNYSTIKEALYIIKMIMPILLIYVLIKKKLNKEQIFFIIKAITLIISGIIIITNLAGISYGSYSGEVIQANFISWFGNNPQNYTYMDLLSKGLFESANQISAVLIMFLSFNIIQCNENKKILNIIVVLINILALMLVGTRVAVIGTIIVYVYTIIIICLYKKMNIKNILGHVICIIFSIILIYYNPIFTRFKEMNNLQDIPNNEKIQVLQTVRYVEENNQTSNYEQQTIIEQETAEMLIKNNYKDKKILDYFILNSYPYEYDTEFWLEIFEKDVKLRTNYRYLEKAMVQRVIEINNNYLDNFLGIGYVRIQNIFNIEQDFIMQYYSLGILGTVLLFLPYIFLIYKFIIKMIKTKIIGIEMHKVLSFVIILFLYAIAYNSGNLLNSLSFTIYFAILYYNIYMPNGKEEKLMIIKNITESFKKYKFLLQQLISRDFKVKYKRSILGVVWSLLYPILTMTVMAIVFSNVFKFSTPGVNYLVYLLTGLVMFNYFSEASNLAMSSVVANFALINKVYIPKYIFPVSKTLFVGINFLLTLIPLYAIIFITGTGVNIYHLLLPYAFICLFVFTLGVSLILSAVSVFLRDMFYIYGIVTTTWMYLTPIMYDIKMISEELQVVFKLNPLYHYINFARTIILYNQIPSATAFAICGGTAIIVLLIGILVFKKNQDKFIYYI